MPTATMQDALRAAAIARALRQAEMGDARRWREKLDAVRAHQLPPKVADDFADRYRSRVAFHVARARKWNRQLVIAVRTIRVGLFARRRPGRPRFMPAPAVRP